MVIQLLGFNDTCAEVLEIQAEYIFPVFVPACFEATVLLFLWSVE